MESMVYVGKIWNPGKSLHRIILLLSQPSRPPTALAVSRQAGGNIKLLCNSNSERQQLLERCDLRHKNVFCACLQNPQMATTICSEAIEYYY
jgi:hypothetical protein